MTERLLRFSNSMLSGLNNDSRMLSFSRKKIHTRQHQATTPTYRTKVSFSDFGPSQKQAIKWRQYATGNNEQTQPLEELGKRIGSSQEEFEVPVSSKARSRLKVSNVKSTVNSKEDLISKEWSIDDSLCLYRVPAWGAPYFNVNAKGNVTVRPTGDAGVELDVYELLEKVSEIDGVSLPLVLRFPEIMCHRIKELQGCFDNAIDMFNFKSDYSPVFPVKCNHDRRLLLQAATSFQGLGLEAGSKPELLLAADVLLRAGSNGYLICNGYKDRQYVELVVKLRHLGVRAVLVLEKLEELPLILQVAREAGVPPGPLGVRAKLGTRHQGHWGATSGDNAKFGLGLQDIWRVVDMLRGAGELDSLQLLHFHIGSQVAEISTIKAAMREASQLYAEMSLLGAPMGVLDVGGGLGLDYTGERGRGPGGGQTQGEGQDSRQDQLQLFDCRI